MQVKSYSDALSWLHSFIDTERSGQFVPEHEDLPRERALLSYLGNPQHAYGITHVAGTKGKGSTCAMVNAILLAAGIRVGLYTQPMLHTFREQIRINGQPIIEVALMQLVPLVQDALTHVDASLGAYITHEVATALAFLCFREGGVEHAVVEVGLGGRMDATNVVQPMVTVITSISYDHTHVLGKTLTEIAREKAGIIKPGVPVICSARAFEAIEAVRLICAQRASPLICVGPMDASNCSYMYQSLTADSKCQKFNVITPKGLYRDLELALLGEHQLENATAAVAVAECLRELGMPINEAAVRRGLQEVRWSARLQVVAHEPWIIVDGAHNADSFAKLFAALRRHFSFERLILVLGMMADKDLHGIIAEIKRSAVDRVIVTAVPHPRAMPPDYIATNLTSTVSQFTAVSTSSDVPSALTNALDSARPKDLVCVAGSLYVAAEALRWLTTHPITVPGTIEVVGIDQYY